MSLKLMFITNDTGLAKIAQASGVDYVFVDLEKLGKNERQGYRSTPLSTHTMQDVSKIRSVLSHAKLLVRVNPIHPGSKKEIDQAVAAGADMLMLPYFKTADEARAFLEMVNGRVRTCLLFETREAIDAADGILALSGIDALHIGLNDLTISHNMRYVFEPLAAGVVDELCEKFRRSGLPFGIGGIARIGCGELPAEDVLTEHARLGSTAAILSRSFFDEKNAQDIRDAKRIFNRGVKAIRRRDRQLRKKSAAELARCHEAVCKRVDQLIAAGWRT